MDSHCNNPDIRRGIFTDQSLNPPVGPYRGQPGATRTLPAISPGLGGAADLPGGTMALPPPDNRIGQINLFIRIIERIMKAATLLPLQTAFDNHFGNLHQVPQLK